MRLDRWWGLSKATRAWIVVGVFVLVAVIYAQLTAGSTYTIEVTGNATGDFNAVTINTGKRDDSPTCRVWALDTFGNRIGSDSFELPEVEQGEQYRWNGHVQVNEPVARYGGEC